MEKLYYQREYNYYHTDNHHILKSFNKIFSKEQREINEKAGKYLKNHNNTLVGCDNIIEYTCNLMKANFYKTYFVEPEKFNTYYFITINPEESEHMTFKKFYDIIDVFVHFKYIGKYEYVIEQRSNFPTEIIGLHCHLILEKTVKKSKIFKDLDRVLSKFFKKYLIHNYVINTQKILDDKRSYLRGNKEATKEMKLWSDYCFRKEEGIPYPVYTNMGSIVDLSVT